MDIREQLKRLKQIKEGVLGGDFGRWGPAVSAADNVRASIDKKYGKMSKDGNPQSDKGGTILWFFIDVDGEDDNRFLGIQYKGDDLWSVRFLKGKGIASSSIVASKSNVKSSQLSSAIRSVI